MSINPLNDISRVYLNCIAEAVDQDGDNDNDFADIRIARMIASGVPKEVAIQKTKNKPYNKKSKSVKEGLIGNQTEIDVAAPYGKLTSDDFKQLRKGKKKKIKEGFSNWREDLIEIADKLPSKDREQKITEKEVNNKIDINPKLNLGEAVENLGGTLLEMVEIDEVDYIVESVYGELLEEGYKEDDIEEALEYALIEAKVTFGHDTPTGQKKKGNLVAAVGRLARQKLSSKVRGAKSAVTGAIASGARQVAKGALGVARKMEGDKKPSQAHTKSRTASTYRGAGAGQKERVSSGSYTPSPKPSPKPESKKASTPVADPWEGSYKTQPKPSPKPQAKTTKVPAKTSEPSQGLSPRQKAAAIRAQRRNVNISPEDLQRVIRNVKEDYWSSVAKRYKEEYDLLEKAESEQQQKIFGLALSVKRGQTPRSEVSDKVLKIVDGMSEKKIRDFAKTKHEGIPHKVEAKEEVIRQELIARMINKIEEQSEVYVDEAKLPSSMKKGKKKLESKTQVIHDVDDNLADQRNPDAAKIDVMRKKSGKWEKVQSLTPSQFAHHKLRKPGEPVKEENDPGDKYGFDQFRDTEKFKKTTKANKPVVRLGDSSRRPAQKSVVTARGGSEFGSNKPSTPMDKPGEFAKDLKSRIGVKNLERKNVHFTGGMRSGSGPEKKAEVVKKIVKPDAKKVITTDDHLQNVRHMAAAASSVAPNAKVRAYQSKPATKAKGKVKTGDIVPVRVGKEGNLKDTNIGIRSNTSPSKSTQETQKRRKQQKMREAIETPQPKEKPQNSSAINQVLQAKAKADAAERDLANKQRMATQKGVNLTSISS